MKVKTFAQVHGWDKPAEPPPPRFEVGSVGQWGIRHVVQISDVVRIICHVPLPPETRDSTIESRRAIRDAWATRIAFALNAAGDKPLTESGQ